MNRPAPLARRDGKFWLFADGTRLPIVSGGDGPVERPSVPEDLSGLTVEQLTALGVSLGAWAAAQTDTGAESLAAVTSALADHGRLQAELNGRTPEAPPSPSLAELAAQFAPLTTPPVPDAPVTIEQLAAPLVPVVTNGFSLEELTAAVTAGVTAAMPAPTPPAEGDPVTASGEMPRLSLLRGGRAIAVEGFSPIRPPSVITASSDVPGASLGSTFDTLDDASNAIIRRLDQIGRVPKDSASEFVSVARIVTEIPAERMLHVNDPVGNMEKLRIASDVGAMVADGGSCVPVQPFYDLMMLSGAHRPVQAAFAGFGIDDPRGGISFFPGFDFSVAGAQTRTVADGVTATNTTVTSATAAFVAPSWGDTGGDLGAAISGAGIPAGAYIVSVESPTSVTISAATTATATGVSITIVRKGAIGYITEAQDAAALGGTLAQQIAARKPFIHVTCPSPITVKTNAISMGLEFSTFTERAFPEQAPEWIRAALAAWARVAETALLDRMSATSTQVTAASVVGGLRTYIAQLTKAVEYYRQRSRLTDDVPIDIQAPHWIRAMATCDILLGSGYDAEFLRAAEALVNGALGSVNATIHYYVDSATGKGQLFAPGGVQGAKQGSGALVAFPTTAVSYIYARGSYVYVGGQMLDLGFWRDSGLNSRNMRRYMVEGFENLANPGFEMLELTSTLSANGTFAGTAYGSSTVSSPVAIASGF